MTAGLATSIHSTACVAPSAQLGRAVQVGPGAMIGPHVHVGDGCWIGPNVVLDGHLTLGARNRVFPGACLGLEPQDLKYRGAPTAVLIGDDNTFRECVTVNRATHEGEVTQIGNGNLLMAYSHLAHNTLLGSGIVIANAVQVAGHVVIEDHAVIGGVVGIHQFVRIGSMAMVGGMSRVVRDVPPFCIAEGNPCRVGGLNRVGLKRRGLAGLDSGRQVRDLERIWRDFYRGDKTMIEALQQAEAQPLSPLAEQFVRFMAASLGSRRRGPMSRARA